MVLFIISSINNYVNKLRDRGEASPMDIIGRVMLDLTHLPIGDALPILSGKQVKWCRNLDLTMNQLG